MHLWIAAAIAFCCVIVMEAQAKRPKPLGRWEKEDEKNPEIQKLAKKAVDGINKLGKYDLALNVILKARSRMAAGKITEFILQVVPSECDDPVKVRTADCQKQQQTCNASIVKELKKPEEVKVNCDPVA